MPFVRLTLSFNKNVSVSKPNPSHTFLPLSSKQRLAIRRSQIAATQLQPQLLQLSRQTIRHGAEAAAGEATVAEVEAKLLAEGFLEERKGIRVLGVGGKAFCFVVVFVVLFFRFKEGLGYSARPEGRKMGMRKEKVRCAIYYDAFELHSHDHMMTTDRKIF